MSASHSTRISYSGRARALLRLGPRLLVAYALVVALIYYCWPQLALPVARGARGLVLVLNPIPYLGGISWHDSGFLISDRIFGETLYILPPSLRFMFGFPLGLALAFPDYRNGSYWRRLFATFLASVAACSAVLAVLADRFVGENFAMLGIEIHPGWYNELLGVLAASFWDLALLYPFIACLLLGRAAIRAVDVGSVSEGPGDRPAPRPWFRSGDFAVLACLLAFGVIELRADHLKERPREQLLEDLAERNPAFGKSLLDYGKKLEDKREYVTAALWYREAAKYRGCATKHKGCMNPARQAVERIRPHVQRAQGRAVTPKAPAAPEVRPAGGETGARGARAGKSRAAKRSGREPASATSGSGVP